MTGLVYARAAALLWASALLAQTPSAELRIDVQDSSGAGVEASGRIENAATHAAQDFRTDAQGHYAATGLPPGRYQLEVKKGGFSTQLLSIDLNSGTPVSRIVTLTPSTAHASVDVVAVTPLAGGDLPLSAIPTPVQVATSADIEQTSSLDLSDVLNKRLNGVFINQNQGNPFQPDVSYRGYSASPLLGTPEGMSVYVDGVRQNQPFGDIVSWDLIPKIAIDELALMPGSDPLYGLNTLGGSVSVQTKDGLSHPGGSIELTGGRFGRRQGEAEYGGFNIRSGLSYYFGGNLYRDDGWRKFSPSEVRQAFGKVIWRNDRTTIGLQGSYASNWLNGNALQDFRFLQQSYNSVYNAPDIMWNRSPSVTLTARREAAGNLTLSGVAYFRYIRADTTSADLNGDSFDQQLYNLRPAEVAALTAAGYSGFPITGTPQTDPFPKWRCIAQGLLKTEPDDTCNGSFTNGWTKQNNFGASGLAALRRSRNQLVIGAALDHASMTFQHLSQFAYLNPDRLTFTPIGVYLDGSTTQDGVPVDNRVYLHGGTNTPSIYATDTLTVGKWNFTFSGRYNHSTVVNIDRLPPTSEGARAQLDSTSVYQRFNPAAGFTFTPTPLASLYFSYSESSRAPSTTELGCSDPENPCNLPNAILSDPPLNQVVTRSLEAGVRSSREGRLRWSAGWFWGQNTDDILFIASEQTGFGYFANFGKTRRDGAEATLSGRVSHFTLGGGYTFLNATYQSAQSISGGSNSESDGGPGMDGDIQVTPGDRIPQIPRHSFKAYANYDPTSKLDVDLDFVAVSSSFARGNENNQDQPDGIYYLGQPVSPGYGVVNIGARYRLRHVEAFIRINNLLNHKYYTAAQLGTTPYDNEGNFVARPFPPVNGEYPIRSSTFFAPGSPIDVFGGLKFRF